MEMTHDRDHPSLLRAACVLALFAGDGRAARLKGRRGSRYFCRPACWTARSAAALPALSA
jgi:hypothetical protein